jgi:hypothetical protein
LYVLHASYMLLQFTIKKKSQKHVVTVLRPLGVLKLKYSMPESNWYLYNLNSDFKIHLKNFTTDFIFSFIRKMPLFNDPKKGIDLLMT